MTSNPVRPRAAPADPRRRRTPESAQGDGACGIDQRFARLVAAFTDLVLPLVCGGCGSPGVAWCTGCAPALWDAPRPLRPRCAVGVPAWALAPYRGPPRRAVLALKESGRRDLAVPLGDALARGLGHLAAWGELPARGPIVLVPAPTSAAASRRRGGDVVTAVCRRAAASAPPAQAWASTTLGRLDPAAVGVRVAPVLTIAGPTRDAVGLSAAERTGRMHGRVRVSGRLEAGAGVGGAVVLVDDVLTTGATAAASVRALRAAGAPVAAVLAVCAA